MQKKVITVLVVVVLILGVAYVVRSGTNIFPPDQPEATVRSQDVAGKVIDLTLLQDKKSYLAIFTKGAQFIDATSFGTGDSLVIKSPQGANLAVTAATEIDGSLYMITQKGELAKHDPNTLQQQEPILRLFAGTNKLIGVPEEDILLVINKEAGVITLVDLIDLATLNTVPVGSLPGTVVIDSYTNLAYVANQGDGSLSVISLDSKLTVTTFGNFGEPVDLLIAPERSGLLVLDGASGTLYAVDLRTNSVVEDIYTIPGPSAMAFSADNAYVLVVSGQQPIASLVNLENVVAYPSFALSDNFSPGGLLDVTLGVNNEFIVSSLRSKVFGVRLNSP